MKRIFCIMSLFAVLTEVDNCIAQTDKPATQRSGIIQVDESVETLRQTISRPIERLQAAGKSVVRLVYDTVNYVDVIYNPQYDDPIDDECITIKGSTLIVDDPEGIVLYEIHLKRQDLLYINRKGKASVTFTNARDKDHDLIAELKKDTVSNPSNEVVLSTPNLATQQLIAEKRKQISNPRQTAELASESEEEKIYPAGSVVEETVIAYEDGEEDLQDNNEIIEVEYASNKISNYYDWEDRIGGAFLWGLHNWGDKWYNGFGKMDGTYNLRTTLSSWQLEFRYAALMSDHFDLSLGIGYESDVYHFSTPLVGMDANGNFQNIIHQLPNQDYSDYTAMNQILTGTTLDDWSSRLVTRYVGIPVSLGFRFNGLKISFTAIPALAINTRHTGLKHMLDGKSTEYQDVRDISQFVNPYKLDLRVDFRFFESIGLFVQTSTIQTFKQSPDAYPIKFGLIIAK